MKVKLTVLFLCFLVLALAQDGCSESQLQKLQTGQITLNPNDLGAAGANKNYYEPLSRGNFGAADYLGYAVAIAGFETSCSQSFFSLIVDIVEPQNENTQLRLVIDFRNKAQTVLTTWTKVKLSYLVSSAQRYPAGITGTSYVWATSQLVDLTTPVSAAPVFTDPIFLGASSADNTRGTGCGFTWDTSASPNKYKFGILCDNTLGNNAVDKDVAIHAYIMGFQYEPDTAGTGNFMAAAVKWNNWMSTGTNAELALWNGAANAQDRDDITGTNYGVVFRYDPTVGGPVMDISNENSQLKSIKVAIVMTVINPQYGTGATDNGFDATTLGYSYSGLYTPVDPTNFNLKTVIDKSLGYDRLQEKLPVVKYVIYGLSSFALKDGSGCTSFSIDAALNSVSSYTITLNQNTYVSNVILQADLYFPQTTGVCSPGVVFQSLTSSIYYDECTSDCSGPLQIGSPVDLNLIAARANNIPNLKYIKTRLSESYETTPSDNVDQYITQLTDNPLSLDFIVSSKKNVTQYVRLNAEVIMNGLTSGKSYGVHLVLVPYTDQTAQTKYPDGANNGKYQFSVSANGFTLYQESFSGAQMAGLMTATTAANGLQQFWYGINIVGNTALFAYNVTVPRDNQNDGFTQSYKFIIDLFEFQQVYDPSTQCCVSQCPAQNGLDVSVTPVACVTCDISKGLTFDPSTSSCTCADGFYLSAVLGFQCFPCQTSLCSVCSPTKPTTCTTCLSGATLNILDNTCSCSAGFYEDSGKCSICQAKCATCKVQTTCDTCADTNRDINNNCGCIAGFYDAGVDKCAVCNPSCATCSSATTCTTCDARKFRALKDSLCVCQDGYFELIYANGTKTCTPCSSECETCSQSAIECSSCDDSINRIQGYDSLGHRTCICKAGYHALTDGACIQSNCKSDPYCSQCQTDLALCIQCQANVNRVIKLPEHICVCADGFYQGVNGTCTPCGDGCAKCTSATNCTNCVAQATLNGTTLNGTCKCATGLYFTTASNGVRYCQQCIQYCDKCSNGLTCQTCKSGFVLSVDNTCICPKNNFINVNGSCVPCKVGCQSCASSTTCDQCIAPLVVQENNCTQKCSSGYYLSGAKCIGCPTNCVACTSSNQCFYCKDNFYLQGGACYTSCPAGTVADNSTFQCVPCNSPCITCSNHPSSCTSCQPGQGYLQVSGTDQSCVKECAEGTFPLNNVCQVCDFRCAKCLGASANCIACPAGRYLYNSACWDTCPGIINNGSCVNECPPGYFKFSNQQCKQCSSECSTCDSNATCLTCANNYLSLGGKCVKDCGVGYYAFRGMCVACDKSCKNCSNTPLQCTVCADNYVSSSGRCIANCANGTYLDTVSKACQPCANNCSTCTSAQFCITCPNPQIVPVGGQCLSCIYPCATCSADLSICNSCLSGYYLSSGNCVRTCPNGTRAANGVCSCASGLFLGGSCVATCPSGYTKVGTDCKRCDSPCTECSGSTTFCTDCLDSYTLKPSTGTCDQSSDCNYGQVEDSSKCVRICDAGLYYQNGCCIFGGCPSGFQDNGFGGCVSSTVQTGRCESPTFKLNGVCTDTCGSAFFPNSNTRTCDACSTNCQNCLNKDYCLTCASGYTAVDGKCVTLSKCSATQCSYNGACLATCPLGTYNSNGRCVRSCPPGSYYSSGWCYNTCPTSAQYYTDNACVATCPAGTNLVDTVCATIV